ncbi:hypothetical protein ANTQUA_LOCUS3481 [Anthophora quadrimaculata]
MCFRIEAFEIQNSTTVAYSTWDYSPNNTTQVFSVVKILRIELRQYYHYRTVVVARFASDTSFRLEAFENQHSNTVGYSTWDYSPNNTTQVFSVVKILGIELRQYYHYRTVVVARFASDTSFPLEAFENQHSNTVAYSTWYYSPNNTTQVFSVVKILGIELRQYYHYRTVVVASFASDTSFRLEAFENQDSTTVAYSTWIPPPLLTQHGQEFSFVRVLRIELQLFYLSRTVVVARCASDTCFRIEAVEIQNSTTVAYETWDYRRNATVHEFSVVIELRIELRLCHRFSTVVVARCASGTCFRIEAFVIQNSTTVAYETWDYRRNTRIQEFSVVIVLRIELRLFYLSRAAVVAGCATDTCFRLEAFEIQNPTLFLTQHRIIDEMTQYKCFLL